MSTKIIIPFGDVLRDRLSIGIKYGLVEEVSGFWRVTKKCKENYNHEDFVRYLKGEIENKDISKPVSKDTIIDGLLDI